MPARDYLASASAGLGDLGLGCVSLDDVDLDDLDLDAIGGLGDDLDHVDLDDLDALGGLGLDDGFDDGLGDLFSGALLEQLALPVGEGLGGFSRLVGRAGDAG